jgi:hypothetical protein
VVNTSESQPEFRNNISTPFSGRNTPQPTVQMVFLKRDLGGNLQIDIPWETRGPTGNMRSATITALGSISSLEMEAISS